MTSVSQYYYRYDVNDAEVVGTNLEVGRFQALIEQTPILQKCEQLHVQST